MHTYVCIIYRERFLDTICISGYFFLIVHLNVQSKIFILFNNHLLSIYCVPSATVDVYKQGIFASFKKVNNLVGGGGTEFNSIPLKIHVYLDFSM